MVNYKYKFSIIMAVYKVEQFLREAIDSIINQTIGIKNIQLILVDDGSPDNCPAICDEYAEKYPDNIFVIHKENGGVSSARNLGLKAVEGKYVNFVDSDDKLTPKTLKSVYKLFEKTGDQTDVVSIPLWFFEGATGGHILNYKFEDGTRIIDLKEDWSNIQLSCSAAFIRTDAIKGMEFDPRLAYGEDANLMQRVIMKKQTLGVVTEGKYMYRKRATGTPSALQNSTNNPKWYLPSVKYFLMDLLDYSNKTLGYVPKFVQYAIMYDIQWRIRQRDFYKTNAISNEEKREYLDILKYVMSNIDEDVILSQKNLSREQRLVALETKYASLPECVIGENDVFCAFSDEAKFSMANSKAIFEFIEIKDEKLKLEGFLEIYNFPFDELELSFWVNNKKVDTEIIPRDSKLIYLERDIVKRIVFKAEIKLDASQNQYKVRLGAIINGKLIFFQKYGFGYFSPITADYRFSNFSNGKWMLSCSKNFIKAKTVNSLTNKLAKAKFLLWILKNNKNGNRYQVFLRLWYHIIKGFYKKPIWLISDRPGVAGDNGEAFFRYMVSQHPEIKAYFVINKNSPDYKKIKKIGPVIKKLSLKHKLYLLLSEYIFSSQGENEHFDPFGPARNVFRDILAYKPFVFLQHGVIMNDLSGWLFRQNKNIFGFITSAKSEYNSIAYGNYDYPPEKVWLTGLPRFDSLYDDSQKIICVMPTWRKGLTLGTDPVTREWLLTDDFAQSEYFNFYNSLINHPLLLKTVQEKGYKINFVLHPNLRAGASFFDSNKYTSIVVDDLDYNKIFAISKLIVTDYSSAIFDFIYMRKPVVYTQFDFEKFFDGSHSVEKGYFEFERDGFGEVEYDLESAVNRIVEYIEEDCKLKEKYRKRIDEFFAFDDKNNCNRVYEKAIEHRNSITFNKK